MTTRPLAVDADARDLAAAEHLVQAMDEMLGGGEVPGVGIDGQASGGHRVGTTQTGLV